MVGELTIAQDWYGSRIVRRFLPHVTPLILLPISLSGCGKSPPEPPQIPILSVSPAPSITFATVVGETSAAQFFTLHNTGNAPVLFSSFSYAGATTSYLPSSQNDCGSTLSVNASCKLGFAFGPKASGSLSETITVTDNTVSSPTVLTLTGTATAPQSVTASVTPTTISFPTTVENTSSEPISVVLANTGTVALSGISIAITGAGSGNFSLAPSCTAPLAVGAQCTIPVTFTPSSASSFSAMLQVTDDAMNSPQAVTLLGTGALPSAPVASLSTNRLDFGRQPYNTSSALLNLTLSNTGNADLTNIAVQIGGNNAADFVSTNNCGTVAPNNSCSIYVYFKPTVVASRSATLKVTDNDAISKQSATLVGGGIVNLQPGRVFWGVDGHRDKGGPYYWIPLWDPVNPNQINDMKQIFGGALYTIFYRAWDDIVDCAICTNDISTLQENGIVPLLSVITYPNPGSGVSCSNHDQNPSWTYFETNAPSGMTPRKFAYDWAYQATAKVVRAEPTNIYWVIGNEWVNQGPISCQYQAFGDGSNANDWSQAASFPIYLGAMAGALQAIKDNQRYAVTVGGASSGSTLVGLAAALSAGLKEDYPGLSWDFTTLHWYEDAANDPKDDAGNFGAPDNFDGGKDAYSLLYPAGKAVFVDEFGSGDGGVLGPHDDAAAGDLVSLMTNIQAHTNSSTTERGIVAANVYSLYQDFSLNSNGSLVAAYTSHFLYKYSEPNTRNNGIAPEGSAVMNWVMIHGNPSSK